MKNIILLSLTLFSAGVMASDDPFNSCSQLLQASRATFYNDTLTVQGYWVYPPSASADPLKGFAYSYGLVAGRDFWVKPVEEGILAVLVQIPRAITERQLIDGVPISPSFGAGIVDILTKRLSNLETARTQRGELYHYVHKAPYSIQSVEFTEQGIMRVILLVSVQDPETAQVKVRHDGGDQMGFRMDCRFAAMSNQSGGNKTVTTSFEIDLLQTYKKGDLATILLDREYEIKVGETTPLVKPLNGIR